MKQKQMRLMSLLLSLALLLSAIPMQILSVSAASVTVFAGGDGTEENPYLISNKTHLNSVRNYLNAHFKMIADIELSDSDFSEGGDFYNDGMGWSPIGTSYSNSFNGVFDGDNHTITGLAITYTGNAMDNIGLFGYSNGTIKNLALVDQNITATSDSATQYVGSIVGYNYMKGHINNCCTSGSITTNMQTGGIAGVNWGTVEQCYNINKITEGGHSGGIVFSNYGTILNCYNKGNIVGKYDAGGICAENNNATIKYCYNTGKVLNAIYRGGIVGSNWGEVVSCYYYETNSLGSGYGADPAIKCSLNEMKSKETFVGFDFNTIWSIDGNLPYPLPTLKNRTHINPLENTTEFAGGTGEEWNPFVIETRQHLNNIRNHLDSCYIVKNDIVFSESDFIEEGDFYNDGLGWLPIGDKTNPFTGKFNGNNHVISGFMINATINETTDTYIGLFGYSSGTITDTNISDSEIIVTGTSVLSTSKYAYIGSLLGYGSVNNCNNSGEIHVTYSSTTMKCDFCIGGVVGYGYNLKKCSNSGTCTFTTTSSSGQFVSGRVGGVVGYATTVESCINTGNITASYLGTVGGVAGYSSTIKKCSNTGNINSGGSYFGTTDVGGICGGGNYFDECFNRGVVIGDSQSCSGGITGAIDGSLRNSFNSGYIDGGWCGGIVGKATEAVTIKYCYNTGFIPDGYNKHAILGGSYGTCSFDGCYSLKGVANTNKQVIEYDLYEMKSKEKYIGFDFNTVWTINNTETYPYPKLQNIALYDDLIPLSDCEFTLDKTVVQYHTLQPKLTVTHNGNKLSANKDYISKIAIGDTSWLSTEYDRNIGGGVGTATITVEGYGKYCGIKIIEFEVTKFDISTATLYTQRILNENGSYSSSSYNMKNFTYDGTAKVQSGFRVCDNNDTIDPSNYDVTYINNIEVGTATMVIVGKGDYYTGKLEKQFEIYRRQISSINVTKKPNKTVYKKSESIDVSGGKITIYYQDGGQETINMTADMLDGSYNLSMDGIHNIWINYNGAATYFEITVKNIVKGDCNGDEKITITDMLAIKSHILGRSSLSGDLAQAADTNKDGKITITDFIQVKAHILGKSSL